MNSGTASIGERNNGSKWKKYLGLVALVVSVAGIALTQSIQMERKRSVESGKTYSFPQEHFQIKFPVEPAISVDSTTDQMGRPVILTTHLAEDFGSFYGVLFIHQSDVNGSLNLGDLLDTTLASDPLNEVISKRDVTFQGSPAKEYEIRNEQGHYKGIIFLRGADAFHIIYGRESTLEIDLQTYQAFFNSFQYVP